MVPWRLVAAGSDFPFAVYGQGVSRELVVPGDAIHAILEIGVQQGLVQGLTGEE